MISFALFLLFPNNLLESELFSKISIFFCTFILLLKISGNALIIFFFEFISFLIPLILFSKILFFFCKSSILSPVLFLTFISSFFFSLASLALRTISNIVKSFSLTFNKVLNCCMTISIWAICSFNSSIFIFLILLFSVKFLIFAAYS